MLQGSKILVTGCTGEVARGITESLAPRNEVWGLARFTSQDAKRSLEAQGVTTFTWALGSGDFAGLPTDFDYVIHAAAAIFETKDDYDASIRGNAEGVGLLMQYLRNAKAFLHVSAIQVYKAIDDKSHPRKEDEPVGSHPNYAPSYGIGKLTAEAVVRTMCRIHNLPTIIGRLGANYGIGCGGVADSTFRDILAGKTLLVPPRGQSWLALVNNGDIIEQVEPLLMAASVPATIVNWVGDEGVDYRELIDYMAEVSGIKPVLEEREGAGPVGGFGDPTKRISLTGPCKHDWRHNIREMIRHNHPEIEFA